MMLETLLKRIRGPSSHSRGIEQVSDQNGICFRSVLDKYRSCLRSVLEMYCICVETVLESDKYRFRIGSVSDQVWKGMYQIAIKSVSNQCRIRIRSESD